ncbi:hypothetical protein [Mesorhizobium sp. M1A.F.Ca.IN.020.03.2.1]|uniref:hypothetical protein n=1 Tax=Mesorhizobium sp. M1A.F.Ca.IN.020.03.2.1 TaxID=2496769 RepID=UPI0013E2A233|nr:hypothetical protein [Mesorhizobium sp. M1A.F.Ca.IN.020.03.2.1]
MKRRLEELREYDAYNPRRFETSAERHKRERKEEQDDYQRRCEERRKARLASFLD